MTCRREDWLHVIATMSGATPKVAVGNNVTLDKVLQLVSSVDADELEHMRDTDTKELFQKVLPASFLSTLSRSEFANYAGLMGEDEDEILQRVESLLQSQTIAESCPAFPAEALIGRSTAAFAPLLPFLKRTEVLLSIGGDDRLTIDFKGEKVNKYFSSTVPRPRLINRGSCTCSSTTLENYQLADDVRRNFIQTVCATSSASDFPTAASTCAAIRSVFAPLQAQLVGRIKRTTGLSPTNAEVVLFPSGSDAEYLPLIAGLVRSNLRGAGPDIKVFNYVCAAGEVGSGTAAAAGGKHFSALLPRGESLPKFDCHLQGLDPSWVTVVQFKPRSGAGKALLDDEAIAARVRKDLNGNATAVAVLHVVCGSKTGLVHPSFDTVRALQEEFGDALIVVVDACQLRCDLRQLQQYTEKGYMTLITGSKFYTAPPFAGAVVVPAGIAEEIERHLEAVRTKPEARCVVPTGLRQYLSAYEAPSTMPNLRHFLSQDNDWVNLGLHLRWSCAVDVMERYSALPQDAVAQFTAQWVERVKALVSAQGPYLRLLPEPADSSAMHADMVSGVSGIVSVVVSVVDAEALAESQSAASAFAGFGHLITPNKPSPPDVSTVPLRALTFDECKEYHLRLSQESHGCVGAQGQTVTPVGVPVRCMLGQPVKLADSGFTVVRIALGADMVVSALENNTAGDNTALDRILREDEAVVTKMSLVARAWHSTHATEEDGHANQTKMAAIDRQLLLPATKAMTARSKTTVVPTEAVALTAAKAAEVLSQVYPGAGAIPPACVLYDLDAVTATAAALRTAFTSTLPAGIKFNHCFAMKAAPLTYLLQNTVREGLGIETASLMEVKQALRCGCVPSLIVFDSPCKTTDELDFALRHGVMVNANSYAEVEKIAAVLRAQAQEHFQTTSVIGLRVNPMVGAGKIDVLSTATATTKFGVPVRYADQDTAGAPAGRKDLREEILATYAKYPFLRAIMCHVGSQGMPLQSMAQGAACILTLADEIDKRARAAGGKGHRITHVDIGGGLSANYNSDTVSPTFLQYAQLLASTCGDQLRSATHRVLLTEFGKALITKCGVIATRVEECRQFSALAPSADASAPKPVLAVVQAGADLMLRTAYCPEKFAHRLALLNAHKQPLTSGTETTPAAADEGWSLQPSTVRPTASVTIAGPLCFSGDVLGSNLPLPEPRVGDVCLVLDAGANTLSLFSRHCSRPSPAVLAFRRVSLNVPAMGQLKCAGEDQESSLDTGDVVERYAVACIREEENEADLLRFWG